MKWQGNPQWLLLAWLARIVYLMQHTEGITTLQAIRSIVPRLFTKTSLWLCRDLHRFKNWLMNLDCCYSAMEVNLTINVWMFKSICIVWRSPNGVDLLWGDKKCQSHSRHDQLCLLFTVDRGTSGGHEDTDTAKTLRGPCWRYNWHFQWSQSGDSVDGC